LIRIDKVFLNRRVQLLEHRVLLNKRTRVASDHLPVLAKLKIK